MRLNNFKQVQQTFLLQGLQNVLKIPKVVWHQILTGKNDSLHPPSLKCEAQFHQEAVQMRFFIWKIHFSFKLCQNFSNCWWLISQIKQWIIRLITPRSKSSNFPNFLFFWWRFFLGVLPALPSSASFLMYVELSPVAAAVLDTIACDLYSGSPPPPPPPVFFNKVIDNVENNILPFWIYWFSLFSCWRSWKWKNVSICHLPLPVDHWGKFSLHGQSSIQQGSDHTFHVFLSQPFFMLKMRMCYWRRHLL